MNMPSCDHCGFAFSTYIGAAGRTMPCPQCQAPARIGDDNFPRTIGPPPMPYVAQPTTLGDLRREFVRLQGIALMGIGLVAGCVCTAGLAEENPALILGGLVATGFLVAGIVRTFTLPPRT